MDLKIKIFAILLTLVTAAAFAAVLLRLTAKLTPAPEKISSPAKEETWPRQLRTVGDKLAKAGLKEQAIEQYSKFLQLASVDSKTRAEVSQVTGELYVELGDCRNGLVWFYQAQAAGPGPSRLKTLEAQIDACLEEVKSKRP